jgi:hypothetical protein
MTLLKGFYDRKELSRIDVEEHKLLKAVPGDAVILGEGEHVFNASLCGGEQVGLDFQPVSLAGDGLKDGVVPIFLEHLAGSQGIRNHPFYLKLGHDEPIHAPPDVLDVPKHFIDTGPNGGLNFRRDNKLFLLQTIP